MNRKQVLAGVLVTATLMGTYPAVAVMPALPTAVTATAFFQDISDPKVAESAEILRLLGVMSGTGSGFNPYGTLTRAEFCKMAVEVMGKGDQEPANRNRTIFRDVGATHWARGYINLASSIPLSSSSGAPSDKEGGTAPTSSDRLIMGVGNGNFEPDTKMTVGSAVAILVRILGYSNADVSIGSVWYDGYLSIAQTNGLLDGLNASGDSVITRAQAAILFKNLLFTETKGSTSIYLTTLKGKVMDELSTILSVDATTKDGVSGGIQTLTETYKTKSTAFSSDLLGTRGKLVLDKDDNVLTILPNEGDTIRRVSVSGVPQANYIPLADGTQVDVSLTTKFIKGDTDSTYEKEWISLRSGASLVLCYSSSGKLEYIYMPTSSSAEREGSVMVCRNKPNGTVNPFAALLGSDKNVIIYRDGAPATVADIEQYDVGSYDRAAKVLNVSSLRLTGYYENAYPNSSAPATVNLLGANRTVLPSAIGDLARFQVGEQITVLLTSGGEIAGAVAPTVAKSTAVGIAEIKDGSATVKLLDGALTITGATTASDLLNGYLVNVTSSKPGSINLSRVNGSGTGSIFNVNKRTLGNKELSAGVRIYEQVENGPLAEIKLSDITCPTVPANKITYVSYTRSGQVERMVLNDVTGDRYHYGIIGYTPSGTVTETDENNNEISRFENGSLTVANSHKENPTLIVGVLEGVRNGVMGGIAPSLSKLHQELGDAGQYTLARHVELKSATGIPRSAFDKESMMVTTTRITLPISDNVSCYNASTKQWIAYDKDPKEALELALAYSNDLTIYYDRAPEDGGKVRIIEVR